MASSKAASGADFKGAANELCFLCDKACGGCSWSRDFTPVAGWTATPTRINPGGGAAPTDSWHIEDCPEFSGVRPPKMEDISKERIRLGVIRQEMITVRKQLGLTQAGMAGALQTSRAMVAFIERGEGWRYTAATLCGIADALGLGPEDYLMSEEEAREHAAV